MTAIQDDRAQVAVYIDFDNIVMSRYDELHGKQAFRDDNAGKRTPEAFIRQRLSEARIEISAIMDFASSFGTVSISRSYADWSTPVNASYANDLLRSSVDLVQMFPITGSKNGADIRLAIDVIDDLARFPYLSHVLIVAGDSDYMSLAQRCRRLGRAVIGIGAAKSVGQFFKAACDEFRFYGNLPGLRDVRTEVPLAVESKAQGVDDAAALVIRAAHLLGAKSADEWIATGGLKAQMLRLDPTFDETGMGYRGFTNFLRAYPNVVEMRWPDGVPGGEVRLADRYANPSSELTEPVANVGDAAAAERQRAGITGDIWKGLGLLTGTGGGSEWERECVAAIRSARTIVLETQDEGFTRTPAREVLASLGGDDPTPAQRRAVHTVFGLLTWLGRDENGTLKPSPEYQALNNEELLDLLRQSVASRAQHKLYPKPVTAASVATAIFGSREAPERAIAAYERAMRLPTVQQMSGTLSPQLLAAPVLWDVACATVAIPAHCRIGSVDDLGDALESPLRELDRDPSSVRMDRAHTLLSSSTVLASREDGGGTLHNRLEGVDPEEVVALVVRQWASRLDEAGHFHPTEPMWLESFYRLVLPDRTRIVWRGWLRALL